MDAESPHGDDLADALIPVVDRLVVALDSAAVASAFVDAGQLVGNELAGAYWLAVLAAGMCSEDHTPDAALGWTVDPAAYQQLRTRADALTASLRAGRMTERGC